MRPAGFYRPQALMVCEVCGHLHDIMTDELIISKFRWMNNMGAGIPTLTADYSTWSKCILQKIKARATLNLGFIKSTLTFQQINEDVANKIPSSSQTVVVFLLLLPGCHWSPITAVYVASMRPICS